MKDKKQIYLLQPKRKLNGHEVDAYEGTEFVFIT